ncbi:hypothetical protein SOV92_06015 [Pectobacterium brasiliense]|uniref:Uncharacterized protein n=1 Tax=Pectobacterium brasiliense TaxID=180957 RepID=A0AAW9H8K2_9GAMM|nr:hypothetical protein [Pectobacterium brasiliense]MDY4377398.1 hypothetical protein [Pectobacterium brasiliense]
MVGKPIVIKEHLIQSKKYVINPKHRLNAAKTDCTQWTVTTNEELDCFEKSINNKYLCSSQCYWWVVDKETCERLGRTDVDDAYIAKFVVDNNATWHGYPVTGKREGDIPDSSILTIWGNSKVIKKKYLRNIAKRMGYV